MKKIIICLLLVIFLSSCTESSANCSIEDLHENLNRKYHSEIMDTEKMIISDINKNCVFWFPEKDKNCIVSFYINSETSDIEKCCITFRNQKVNSDLFNSIKEILTADNKYFKEKRFKSEKYLMITLYDTRTEEKNTAPTLKKHIKEEDIY